jgi:hypothetical protein
MYRWLRNTHLCYGLFAFLAVLMYGFSSIGFAHRTWLPLSPRVTVAHIRLNIDDRTNERAVARALMDERGMRGDLQDGKATPAGFAFRIERPGVSYEIDYAKGTGDTTITTRTAPFMGIMTAIHKEHGMWHDDVVQNLWGAYLGIVSGGLIVLALTGIYLWFKLHKERRTGLALLVISLGFSATMIVLLGTA